MKKRQRNERQPSQLPTAPQTRLASRPLAAPISQANPITTRRAAQLNALTENQSNDQRLYTVSSHADSMDRYDSIINELLDSDDDSSSESVDRSGPEAVEQHLDATVQDSSLSSTGDQSYVPDRQMSGEPRDAMDAAEAGTSNGEAIEENPELSSHDNTVSQAHGPDGQTSRQIGDGTGLKRDVEEGPNNNRELPSYDSSLDQSLYPHAHTPDHAVHGVGLETSAEEGETQPGEDDLSLSNYLTIERTRISSKLQKLKSILHICDESLRIMTDFQVSEESHLIAYRYNAKIAKEGLDMAQHMEQNSAAFESMADPRDDTSSQQAQSLLNAASDFRKTCQEAYERTKADIEAMEVKFNTRQEHLSRIEEKRRIATIELQAWRDWQADGAKIFSS